MARTRASALKAFMIECRVIVAGESVLLITHFALVDDYPTKADPVEAVLATLLLASN